MARHGRHGSIRHARLEERLHFPCKGAQLLPVRLVRPAGADLPGEGMRRDPRGGGDAVKALRSAQVQHFQQRIVIGAVAVAHEAHRGRIMAPERSKQAALHGGEPPRIDRRAEDHQLIEAEFPRLRPHEGRGKIYVRIRRGERGGEPLCVGLRPSGGAEICGGHSGNLHGPASFLPFFLIIPHCRKKENLS